MMQTQQRMLAKRFPAPILHSARNQFIQRKCACGGLPGPTGECSECRNRRKRAPQFGMPLNVDEVLRTPGASLDTDTLAFMGSRFGHDFRRVRVHCDRSAARSAEAIDALAYTIGTHLVFGPGQYAPQTNTGRHLLAHELAHVVQAAGSLPIPGAFRAVVSEPGDNLELAAQSDANKVLSGQSLAKHGSRTPDGLVQRQTKSEGRRLVTFVTRFHPGVNHDHKPTGRWSDVQKDASARCEKIGAELSEKGGSLFSRRARCWRARGRSSARAHCYHPRRSCWRRERASC